MIEIIFDKYELYNTSDVDSLITETSQFEKELLKIKSSAESGGSRRIIVRTQVVFNWFDAANKYGAKKRIIDPVAMLAGELKQSVIPRYLQINPRWVVELGLLEKVQEDPGEKETIEVWLKRVLLGNVWIDSYPDSQEELSALFAYFVDHDEAKMHPLERHLVGEHLQKWQRKNPDKGELISWLQQNAFSRAKFIIWEQLLSLFPDDKVSSWLQQDEIWYELSQFPNRIQLPHLSTFLQLPENIASFARFYIQEQWRADPDKAIGFISGQLDFEKNFLLEQLRQQFQNEVPLDPSVYEKLIELDFPEVVSLARQLVPAQKPSALLVDCPLNEMQRWLANEYLPFYRSCSLLGQVGATEPHVAEFEKWMGKHYTSLLFEEGMAYRQIVQLKNRVLADDPILMVVFDGLDYLCAYDKLLPVMQDNGFFPVSDLTPFFSFLPTQTNIAKPTLVAGKMKSQIPDEVPTASFYKELLQSYLGISEDAIRSKTDKDGTLLELIQEPALAYLYLDNTLDRELLHSNIRQYMRQKKYDEYIRKQAEKIAQCLKDYKEMYGKSLQVIICSDHGYTTIPKTAAIIQAPTGTSKTRTLFGHTPEDLDAIDQEQIWKLNPDLHFLDHEMIIPRGYSCFKRRPLGATHGGCSPQEMAVPWFLLSEDKPKAIEPPNFSIDGDIFRKRADNSLVLNISNQNNYSVTNVLMDITGVETTTSLPMNIGKNNTHKFHFSFNASAIGESFVEVTIQYRLKSMAGEFEKNLILKVPTTGAMSTEFDDDFDF
jgi:hypothetical protein